MRLKTVHALLYFGGIAAILASWVGLVSGAVGFLGWAAAMAGWGMQFLPAMRGQRASDELRRHALRARGVITDEEFAAAKGRLLGTAPPETPDAP